MSSIHVYFTKEVKESEGYRETEHSDKGQHRRIDMHLGGNHLFKDEGDGFYIMLNFLGSSIPKEVEDIVVGVSMHDQIPSQPKRVFGRYSHGSASAVLDSSNADDRDLLQIRSTTLEGTRELYHMIRAGTIRPTESWETEQISELRSGWNRFLDSLRHLPVLRRSTQ